MKKILITGGAGMIGQAIARKMVAVGWEVTLYDDWSNPFTPITGYTGKLLRDWREVVSYLAIEKPDVISHQAALVGVGDSMVYPEQYSHQNSHFTAKLIQVIIDIEWKGVIMFASSMGVYGEGNGPVSYYGLSKKYQEDQLRLLAENYPGITVRALRYFSVYSTDFNPENPRTGILSIIADQIMSGGPVEMYGDGTQTRDLIHVDDVAEIHYSLMPYNSETRFYAVDVRTGKVAPLKNIVSTVCEVFGYTGPVIFNGKTRAGDIDKCPEGPVPIAEWKDRPLRPEIEKYREFLLANRDKFLFGSVREENLRLFERGLVK